MRKEFIAAAAGVALLGAPCRAAELLDEAAATPVRSSAVAGTYLRIPLGGSASTVRAGLRLGMSHSQAAPRAMSVRREANLLDLRFGQVERGAFYVAGRPVIGPQAERMNAGGESKGRLDKIMIGAGIALGAVAAFFLVSSVAN